MKLVIVESPTKAKTITKFVDKQYHVESSFGHVRDLPKNKLGVDVADQFTPTYVVPVKAKERVAELKKLAKQADEIYLATDEDREGEAIAWHLESLLSSGHPMKRITFHEITKSAILEALEHPRDIDPQLVNAQQARRILDRLVGYKLSPFLWTRVQYGLSAGRVQSVAVRLIVERERERRAFKQEEYWTIDVECIKDAIQFAAALVAIDGKKLEKLSIKTEQEATAIVTAVSGQPLVVQSVEKKEVGKKGPTPLTTSTLQIEANGQLGFSAKKTMIIAQKLYETGFITYMRTDSLNIAEQFLTATQSFLKSTYGERYATGAQRYKTKKAGAQEAHEAIRPTDVTRTPDAAKFRDAGLAALYELIWRRTVASQMPDAVLERTTVDMNAKQYTFRATGSTVVFDGFMKVYHATKEKLLPALANKDEVEVRSVTPNQHFTEPPARYSDASLVKALEEYGIGRPSTYAPTISTIIDRGYVNRDEGKRLFPTDIGMLVNDLLVEHFPQVVDYAFTAQMEKKLDDVAEGTTEWVPVLKQFYDPFISNLEAKEQVLKKEDIMKERVLGNDPKTGLPVIVKNGRFGPFVQVGVWTEEDKKAKKPKPRSASLLKGQSIDTITLEQALPLLTLPRVVGTTADGVEIMAADGRFGPYVKAGETSASLGEQFDPRTITEEDARALLTAAAEKKKKYMTPIAELGTDPNSNATIQVRNGRYGPYVTDGTTHVSLTKKLGIAPEEVTHEQAVELLEKKRKSPKRRWRSST